MPKSIKKSIILLSMVAISGLAFFGIYDTMAYLNDLETSTDNVLGMGNLDFSLASPQSDFVSPEKILGLVPGLSIERDIYIKKEGSLPFQYKASVDSLKCDPTLLANLRLEVWYNYLDDEALATASRLDYLPEKKYDGLLVDFKDFDTNLPTHDPDLQISNQQKYYKNIYYSEDKQWLHFKLSLASDAPAEVGLLSTACNFDFVFDAWQENYNQADQVFSDSERISNSLSLSGVLDIQDDFFVDDEKPTIDPLNIDCGDDCPKIIPEDPARSILLPIKVTEPVISGPIEVVPTVNPFVSAEPEIYSPTEIAPLINPFASPEPAISLDQPVLVDNFILEPKTSLAEPSLLEVPVEVQIFEAPAPNNPE